MQHYVFKQKNISRLSWVKLLKVQPIQVFFMHKLG